MQFIEDVTFQGEKVLDMRRLEPELPTGYFF
jgi:hypothetical protein